jgi:hypothetical protein
MDIMKDVKLALRAAKWDLFYRCRVRIMRTSPRWSLLP